MSASSYIGTASDINKQCGLGVKYTDPEWYRTTSSGSFAPNFHGKIIGEYWMPSDYDNTRIYVNSSGTDLATAYDPYTTQHGQPFINSTWGYTPANPLTRQG